MKKTSLKIAILGLSTFLFTGCATIVNDKTQPVTFNTIPNGAMVKVNGQLVGKTPISYNVVRDDSSVVRFEKEGYDAVEKPLKTEISGAFWGNILIGGLFGSTTDASNKKMYEFAPNQYTVELKKTKE